MGSQGACVRDDPFQMAVPAKERLLRVSPGVS